MSFWPTALTVMRLAQTIVSVCLSLCDCCLSVTHVLRLNGGPWQIITKFCSRPATCRRIAGFDCYLRPPPIDCYSSQLPVCARLRVCKRNWL